MYKEYVQAKKGRVKSWCITYKTKFIGTWMKNSGGAESPYSTQCTTMLNLKPGGSSRVWPKMCHFIGFEMCFYLKYQRVVFFFVYVVQILYRKLKFYFMFVHIWMLLNKTRFAGQDKWFALKGCTFLKLENYCCGWQNPGFETEWEMVRFITILF